MYNKIVENFRKRLSNFQNPTENQQPERSEPQQLPQQSTSQLAEQLPAQTHSEIAAIHTNENFIPFPIDSSDSLKVYENDQIEVFIEKTLHQRHKRFQLQDFLYNIKIKVKTGEHRPLLKDLIDVLEKALSFILNNIRTYFKKEDANVVYVDLFQSPMINALNSGGYLLSDDSNEVIQRLLSILNQFLISDNNINLELNDTFKIYVNVFSVDHVNFNTRNQRNPQPNKRKKHYGSKSLKPSQNYSKLSWAIDVPQSYESNPNIFLNKCFLVCIILGLLQNSYYKSNRVDTTYLYAQGINYSSKRKQKHAGNILKSELQKLISNLSLSQSGPYEIQETANKICDFYNCQIFIFSGMENTSKLKYIFPNEVDENRQPIYLYEPFQNENHILFIKNLQSYFKSNRKVCFQCFKTFKSYRYLHRCIRTLTCFACRRKFCSPNTYIHYKLKSNFCDSKINLVEKSELCKICNCSLKTKHCQKGHTKICNGKGQFGYKCLKCKKFTYRRNNDTSDSLKLMHECGFLRCSFCSSYFDENSLDIHLCTMKKETIPNKWPSICFLKCAFQQFSANNCNECFEKKMSYCKENSVPLKDVLKNDSIDFVCENHASTLNILIPNLIIMYKEHNVKRGIFTRFTISNLFGNQVNENIFQSDYCEGLNLPSPFVNKTKKTAEDFEIITKTLKYSKNEELTLIQQFCKEILCNENKIWQNTTFILHDEDSMTLNFILESLLNLGLAPEIVRNGKNIYLLNIPQIQVKFIRINNYLSGNEFDIAKQFNIDYELHFFPDKINNLDHVDFEGEIPDINFFLNFSDSTLMRKANADFINRFKESHNLWNFKKELFTNVDYKVNLLTQSCMKFVQSCLNLQNLIQEKSPKKYIHPFGIGICTIASFTFKLFKCFFLNDFSIFSIHNEFTNDSKEISQQEAEWAAYRTFRSPQLNYYSALEHPKGQKYFPEAIPDLYSPVSKIAHFYCGCFWHGHYENCLLNPNATATSKNDVLHKTYGELTTELYNKTCLLLQNHPSEIESVVIHWECEFLKQKETLPEFKLFLENHYIKRPLLRLNPRSAVRGAICDNFALKWTKAANLNEDFLCLDLNGMYSYCAMKNVYMTGPYKVLIGNLIKKIKFTNGNFYFDTDENEMHGTMHVTILPPKNLYIPFLLYRLKSGFTVSTLCSKCAENAQYSKCKHSDYERAFSSTYFISELKFALSLVYTLLSIHECHYFKKAEFVLKNFVQKINCLKIQNSDCLKGLSEEEKVKYCTFLNNTMDLIEPFCLKPNNISPNESAKSLYKLIANSLFGKLEQKHYQTKTKFAMSQNQLENLYFSSNVQQIFCLNENICQVEIEPDLKQRPNRDANCYLGGQVTAYARQLIYEYIQKVSEFGKVFYVDCDCIYFSKAKDVQLNLPISDATGHFKHVFPGEILSFYSLGPKSYVVSFQTQNKEIKSITKVKGITLTSYYNENEINSILFENFMDSFLKEQIEKIHLCQLRSKHNSKSLKIDQKMESISFSNQVTSRRIVAKECQFLTTSPFGYEYYPT